MKRAFVVTVFCILTVAVGGCAFFNTFYHARKSYNSALTSIRRVQDQTPAKVANPDVPPGRFSMESATVPAEARTALDVAIEKANKVIVLHPGSGWVENAILLSGKAHYMRSQNSDLFDARNRFQVFLNNYPESKYVPEARLWHARALWKTGLPGEALAELDLVIRDGRNDHLIAEALIVVGDIEWERGDFQTAAKRYAKATGVRDVGIRKNALYKAAYGYYTVHDLESSLYYMEQLVRLPLEFQEEFDARFMYARILKEAGRYDQAIRILDRLLGNPKYGNLFVRAEYEIGDVLRLQGKRLAAQRQLVHVIKTYNHAAFSGDCYYLLGLMYDSPDPGSDEFKPDPVLALKLFNQVKTRFGSSTFFADASARVDRAITRASFHHAITTDELLLKAAEARIKDSTDGLTVFWPMLFAVTDSADLVEQDTENEDPQKSVDPMTEVYRSRLSSESKDAKQSWAEQYFLSLTETTDQDTLFAKKRFLWNQIQIDYALLADYFYYELSEFDSAYLYYSMITENKNHDYREYALYGVARVMQKKKHPDYLSYFRAALGEFPSGALASIGRYVLGDVPDDSSPSAQLFAAENLVLDRGDFNGAENAYLKVALTDSNEYRWRAVYALGWLNETKLHRNDQAFRYYQTLIYARPELPYAKMVKPKCDAFIKSNNIPSDSLANWIDTRFVSIRSTFVKSSATDPARSTVIGKQEDDTAMIDSTSAKRGGRIPPENPIKDNLPKKNPQKEKDDDIIREDE